MAQTLIHRCQAAYEHFVRLTASPASSHRYSHCLDVFFDYFPDKTEPGHFSRSDVDKFRAYRRKKGVSARTVNYDIQIIKAFFNYLIREELATFNPAATVSKLREMEQPKYSLSDIDQEQLYAACLNENEKLLVGLSLTTGLRCKSLVELERKNFDFIRKVVIIPPEKMKSGRALELPIRDELLALIHKRDEGKIWGTWAPKDAALSRRFNLLLQRIGISLKGLRTARRSVATTMLRNGADIRLVRDMLGHTSITTTSKYLTQATTAELRDAMSTLPGRSAEG